MPISQVGKEGVVRLRVYPYVRLDRLRQKPAPWPRIPLLPFAGGIKVKEAYLETGVPIASGKPFFHQLDLNGAMRRAHYSASGLVYTFAGGVSSSTNVSNSFDATTWKIGGNWAPVEDIRFRITRSRDIRAPSIIDLYNGSQFSGSTVTYNGATVPLFQLTRGNPTLTPEKADTLTYGVVLKPGFLPGFQASIDYYDIDLKRAIGGLLAQQQVNLCAAGDQSFCALQSVANGAVTVINHRSTSIPSRRAAGTSSPSTG